MNIDKETVINIKLTKVEFKVLDSIIFDYRGSLGDMLTDDLSEEQLKQWEFTDSFIKNNNLPT